MQFLLSLNIVKAFYVIISKKIITKQIYINIPVLKAYCTVIFQIFHSNIVVKTHKLSDSGDHVKIKASMTAP